MKKFVWLIFFLITIQFISSAQRIVKVGAFNFYPGIFQDTDGEVKGFYVDALNEIGKNENIKFVFVYGSWYEGLDRIKDEKVDLLTSVAFTEDRARYMDYALTPLLTVWGEVYVKPSTKIHGILDLKDKRIAVMKGDLNGAHLQELTRKLSIPCTFVETPDFKEVFNLISSKKVDAGVVNNTFGAAQNEEYGLLSSGIVFNPFDIFFTVKKGQNAELLTLLNNYLEKWKFDRNSVYNTARQKWSHGKVGSIEVFPPWFQKVLFFVLVLMLGMILFIVLLRYRVKIATIEVRKSESKFKLFMDNTPAFVYIKDENLNHIYKNKMVENILGQPVDNEPTSAKKIFEPPVAEMLEETDRKILNKETEQLNIQYNCQIQNQKRWLHDYKFSLSLPNDKSAIGGISFDITKQKETEQELILSKEKAEESDRLKSAFLANMSHEIRTPMNGLLGFAELLKEPDLTEEQRVEYYDIIDQSVTRMLNTFNNIVDISKIESGQMTISISKTNVNDKLTNIYSSFKPEAERKGLKISCKINLPPTVTIIQTDQQKLTSILSNLTRNALKFTQTGGIEIGCGLNDSTEITTNEAVDVVFYLNDTGIGILPEQKDFIFDRFRQGSESLSKKYEGAGLGLAISKAYVEMLGGKIWVESEAGKGSTFYFSIPCKVVNE